MASTDPRDADILREIENSEWRESLDYVLKEQGADRVRQILRLLQTLNEEHGKTIVMVTHSPAHADYARRTVRLLDGAIVDDSANAAVAV